MSGTAGGTLTGNTIAGGIYDVGSTVGAMTDNSIGYNNSLPIRLPADAIGGLLAANTITNTDGQSRLEATGGTITHDAVWTAAFRYIILGNVTVKGTDGADGITTLTIEPGAQLRFDHNTQLTIGAYSGDPGAFVARGTAAEPIVFTSNEATPAAGDWSHIKFDNTSDDAASVLDHCIVEYAGSDNKKYEYRELQRVRHLHLLRTAGHRWLPVFQQRQLRPG